MEAEEAGNNGVPARMRAAITNAVRAGGRSCSRKGRRLWRRS